MPSRLGKMSFEIYFCNAFSSVVYFITMSFLGVDNENQYNDCIKQQFYNHNHLI